MWKVYKHTSPSNKVYIGITSKDNPNDRWKNGKGYTEKQQPYFHRAIEKYGWDNIEHVILFDNLTQEEAFQKEIELISYYDATNKEKGYNVSLGGEAIFKGRHHSDETKEKISKTFKDNGIHQGKDNPMYGTVSPNRGKHHTEETKQKLSEIKKKYFEENGFSESLAEYIEKHKRKVNQYDLEGNFIASYDSATQASEIITGNKKGKDTIINVCNRKHNKNGAIIKSYKGFQWRYAEDCDDIGKYNIKKADHSSQEKSIVEIDTDGNVIKQYNSIAECAKLLELNPSSITQVCKGNYETTKGHIFKYA